MPLIVVQGSRKNNKIQNATESPTRQDTQYVRALSWEGIHMQYLKSIFIVREKYGFEADIISIPIGIAHLNYNLHVHRAS